MFIQYDYISNLFEMVPCKMVSILSRPQYGDAVSEASYQ